MLTSGMKTDIARHYSYYGNLPTNLEQTNAYVRNGSYISDINIKQGVITSKFKQSNETLADLSLSFVPALAKQGIPKVIKWACGYASTTDDFVLQGVNQTNVPPKYLTATCRSSTGEL